MSLSFGNYFGKLWASNYAYDYLKKQQTCVIVSFAACLTSLIFQKQRIGFKDEFRYICVTAAKYNTSINLPFEVILNLRIETIKYGR